MFRFTKPRWNVVKDKKVCETPIFSLHEKMVVPDKSDQPSPFYVLDAPEWINVIALTDSGNIVLVEQYRHGIEKSTLEIPGGMVDEGESPLESAKRELLEETGFSSSAWKLLGKTSSNPAIFTNFTHLYLADECAKISSPSPDGHEDIKVHEMELSRFLDLVRSGTVHHAIVLAAVSHLLLQKPELAGAMGK